MTPIRIVVSGYATLDYVIQTDEPFLGTGTVQCELGVSGAWPRAGGAALYASRRIAAAGHRAFALTWIGDDGDGGHYLRACQRAQICCEAIEQRRAVKTPRCVLVYGPSGDYGCLLDTGQGGQEQLTPAQAEIVAEADHLCITAGPPQVAHALLDLYPESRPLSWIAKGDHVSFPDDLCARLAARASLIFCNASERAMIEAACDGNRRADQIIVETLGSAGVLIDSAEGKRLIPASAVQAHDTTGAGDTLAGEAVAHWVLDTADIDAAVSFGMAAARDLLASRTPKQDAERL